MSGKLILNSKVRAQLGITYLKTNQYNEAIEQFVGITLLLDVIDRLFVREIYLIIAETLMKLNDTFNAVKYYSKFLEWYDEIGKSDPELWYDTCERIICIYSLEDRFDCSVIYAKKLLEYRLQKSSDCFDDIMNSQLIVTMCYYKIKE
jgi:tetratricopeptide (TPR) repeat protein